MPRKGGILDSIWVSLRNQNRLISRAAWQILPGSISTIDVLTETRRSQARVGGHKHGESMLGTRMEVEHHTAP